MTAPAQPPRPPASSPAAPRFRRAPSPAPSPASAAIATGQNRPPADGLLRLNKRMADLGLASRREADEWIERGWVQVNGQIASVGQKVGLHDRISVHRAAGQAQAQRVTILLHKPVGYVSGQAEDGHPPAASLIGARSRWARDGVARRFDPAHLRGLAPAGRLDIDSTGLLALTQDGRVARHLIGEDSAVDKEYLVRVAYDSGRGLIERNVQAALPPAALARLRHGLSLDGRPLKPAQVSWQNPEQLRFVLTEGKKRQIRRMCELVGLRVTALKRIRIGRIALGALPVGQWRYLGEGEMF